MNKCENFNEKLDRILQEVIEEARECKIPVSRNINKSVEINRRAKKRFGACKLIKKGNQKHFTIEIGSALYNSEEKIIRGVIAHEVLHTCNGAMNHGTRWKEYARRMNDTYGYNIKRTSSMEEMNLPEATSENPGNNRYAIRCRKCGNVIYRMRKSSIIKNPGNYRCRCGGSLEVYRLK